MYIYVKLANAIFAQFIKIAEKVNQPQGQGRLDSPNLFQPQGHGRLDSPFFWLCLAFVVVFFGFPSLWWVFRLCGGALHLGGGQRRLSSPPTHSECQRHSRCESHHRLRNLGGLSLSCDERVQQGLTIDARGESRLDLHCDLPISGGAGPFASFSSASGR